MGNAAMAPLKFEIETLPFMPNLLPKEPTVAIQVEELVQAVAEGVLRAVEARGGSTPTGTATPDAALQAGSSRASLISQLTFELRIRAGGIPAAPFLAPTAE